MELLRRLVQVAHPEGHIVEHSAALALVVQVHPQLHGLFQRLQQLAGQLRPLAQVEPAHGQIDFLGQDLVALQRLFPRLARSLPLVLLLELVHPVLVALLVGGVAVHPALLFLGQLLVFLSQVLDLLVVLLDVLIGLTDLILFLRGVQGLLHVEHVGAQVLQLLALSLLGLQLRAAQAALFLLLPLQLQDLLIGGRAQLQMGVLVQLSLGPVHHGTGHVVQLHHGVRQLVVAEDDGAVVNIAV